MHRTGQFTIDRVRFAEIRKNFHEKFEAIELSDVGRFWHNENFKEWRNG
jgi:hypothetical protein